jgi:hypothetical protein
MSPKDSTAPAAEDPDSEGEASWKDDESDEIRAYRAKRAKGARSRHIAFRRPLSRKKNG